MMRESLVNVLTWFIIIVCLIGIIWTSKFINDYIEEEKAVEELVQAETSVIIDENNESIIEEIVPKYSDVHLRIDETLIDYDIMQGDDNEYYLTHTADGEYNKAGWLFYDYRVTDSSQNKIIYGHNRVTGIMFGSLSNLASYSYYVKNGKDVIHLTDNEEEKTYRVFAVYVADVNFDYLQCDFEDSEEFNKYLSRVREKNIVELLNEEVITEDSEIITLSTCAGEDRLVVHGVRI